jgi:hypothetical protein
MARSRLVMDVDARRKEIYEEAFARKFNGDFYFGYEQPPQTLEDFQSIVRSSKLVRGMGSFASKYSLPTVMYWTARVASLAGGLGQVQFMADEQRRVPALDSLCDELARCEQKRLETCGGAIVNPIWGLTKKVTRETEIYPEDQVAIVRGGISLLELQQALNAVGQCIPLPAANDGLRFARQVGVQVSDAIALNLPHGLEAQCGSWRDWILGMTVMLADGSIVKSGSQAVKNVAGYDAHKLFVGARGTLGWIVEVILKTFPIDALPKDEVEVCHEKYTLKGPRAPSQIWIQRTRRSDFPKAIAAAGDRVLESDRASSTMWAHVPYEDSLIRFTDDWVLRRDCLEKNVQLQDSTQIALMKKAKEIFDPTNKFNPGEFGF